MRIHIPIAQLAPFSFVADVWSLPLPDDHKRALAAGTASTDQFDLGVLVTQQERLRQVEQYRLEIENDDHLFRKVN